MANHEILKFLSGVYNRADNEDTPKDSAKDSLNWITIDEHIELARGKVTVGNEGVAGSCTSIWVGYRVDGTPVLWRKIGTKIQYFNGTTWIDVVTGLNASDVFVFANYSSLAGAFTFAGGPGGLFKFANANPWSYIDMYDATRNFKGYILIDKARTLMWGLTKDPTGLYGSYIDAQNGSVYTTVSNENLASGNGSQISFSGTLAFKASNPKANCFGVTVKCTDAGGEIFTDDFNGNLKGSAGGTGTINYITGAWQVTFVTVPANSANNIKADYQRENSNTKGITDFTKSATRLAGEGFTLRQDEGGDAIMQVLLGIDGAYYSIKKQSAYRYIPDDTDTKPTNEVVRRGIGISSKRSAVATGRGIVFINTANPDRPELNVLEQNPLGDNIIATQLIPHFAWEQFGYDDMVIESYGQFIVISCKDSDSTINDRLLLVDIIRNTVDITHYGVKSLTKDGGILYGGSPHTETVYKLLNGFDDDGFEVQNRWDSKDETYRTRELKKYRRLRYRGDIDPAQYVEVYMDYDGSGYQLVGTIRGDASYVDRNSSSTVGSSMVGESTIGGEGTETVYPYEMELKARKIPKFRKRSTRFIAKGIGYVSIKEMVDFDILTFEDRIPKRYRQKQNISLDGKQINQ